MKTARGSTKEAVARRTIRFNERLRLRIAAAAERCGRGFGAQVTAILRRHYGEDVDLGPRPGQIIAHAQRSLAGLSATEIRSLTRRLK